jgi:hypothetical protein
VSDASNRMSIVEAGRDTPKQIKAVTVAADSNLKVTTDLWRQLHLDGVAALVDAISDKKRWCGTC